MIYLIFFICILSTNSYADSILNYCNAMGNIVKKVVSRQIDGMSIEEITSDLHESYIDKSDILNIFKLHNNPPISQPLFDTKFNLYLILFSF